MKITYKSFFITFFFLQFLVFQYSQSMDQEWRRGGGSSNSSASPSQISVPFLPPAVGASFNFSVDMPVIGINPETMRKNNIPLWAWNALKYPPVLGQEGVGGSQIRGISSEDFLADVVKRDRKIQKLKQVGVQALKVQFTSDEAFFSFMKCLGERGLLQDLRILDISQSSISLEQFQQTSVFVLTLLARDNFVNFNISLTPAAEALTRTTVTQSEQIITTLCQGFDKKRVSDARQAQIAQLQQMMPSPLELGPAASSSSATKAISSSPGQQKKKQKGGKKGAERSLTPSPPHPPAQVLPMMPSPAIQPTSLRMVMQKMVFIAPPQLRNLSWIRRFFEAAPAGTLEFYEGHHMTYYGYEVPYEEGFELLIKHAPWDPYLVPQARDSFVTRYLKQKSQKDLESRLQLAQAYKNGDGELEIGKNPEAASLLAEGVQQQAAQKVLKYDQKLQELQENLMANQIVSGGQDLTEALQSIVETAEGDPNPPQQRQMSTLRMKIEAIQKLPQMQAIQKQVEWIRQKLERKREQALYNQGKALVFLGELCEESSKIGALKEAETYYQQALDLGFEEAAAKLSTVQEKLDEESDEDDEE